MHLTFQCPACRQLQGSGACGPEQEIACPKCGWRRQTAVADFDRGKPIHCLLCGNPDLWRQKDFPQRLGVLLVVSGAVLSSIAWYYHRPVIAFSILGGFALADMVLFGLMADVLVCYRCQTRHHGASPGPEYPLFDHGLAEKYRQEAIRMQQSTGTPSGR